MIVLRSLTLARGARTLLQAVNLQIHPGWRVGLTGANGCGKSSLFALLRGELMPSAGDLAMPAGWRIGYVAQETPALEQAAIEYVLDGDAPLRAIEAELEAVAARSDAASGERMSHLHAEMELIEGYAARGRAAALLAGLGFAQAELTRPVASFSGGWRMRLNLAQALMSRADLLLLDEPTNHLDLEALIWLEQWLRSYRGTLILISHDRMFLDACVERIAHIEQQQVRLYSGNYSDFEQARAARLANEAAMYARQQREIAHMEDYIRRFRAKATKARQAQSRIKALERMERIACAHVDRSFSLRFGTPPPAGDPLLRAENIALGHGDGAPLLHNLSFALRAGERIGLLGVNGAGKSTLMHLLAGLLPASGGRLERAKNLVCGFFAQHQTDALRLEESPLQHLQHLDPEAREQDLRNWLGRFGFSSDAEGENAANGADVACGSFSGGEKARLALALLTWKTPNLLLLDEPTNHLDLAMRDALGLALCDFDGAMVVISHDRALLGAVCERFWLVDDGRLSEFDGDLDDYRAWLAVRRKSLASDAGVPVDVRQQRQQRTALRQQRLGERRSLGKERERLEKNLHAWQGELESLNSRLADPALYDGGDSGGQAPALLAEWLKRQAWLAAQIEPAETQWLELSEQIDALEQLLAAS